MHSQEKAKGPGYAAIHDRFDDVLYELISDFKNGKPLHWPVLPKYLVHRVWENFSTEGYVADERALQNIYTSMRDNVVRLGIANIVSGHEEVSPESILDDLDTEQHEEFCTWLIESPYGWRISDYGFKPLMDAVALAFEAKTDGARLKYLDRALHVTHCRGDLSLLFIEGGRNSALSLSEVALH